MSAVSSPVGALTLHRDKGPDVEPTIEQPTRPNVAAPAVHVSPTTVIHDAILPGPGRASTGGT